MEAWQIGLIVFAIVGAAALVLAYRRDRTTAARVKEALRNPPDRQIPGLDPATSAPHYLTDAESRQSPAGAPSTDLNAEQRKALHDRLDTTEVARIPGGYPQREFATDSPTGWAVLDDPLVLVSSDEITAMRELLPVLALLDEHPLVVVAPGFTADVVDTLRANKTRRALSVCPVITDHGPAALADLVDGRPLTAADLQAGYVPRDALGRARRWISDAKQSWIVV
ncbi:hypothetical protein [Propionicicella superfundia]|uniref:hypothetical protein n=1 Tax=Propionicicella superfundia TaxID=348582 RepID=UPI0003F69023|nr:hypothetical protein [Propionicicella superfundia]